MPWGKYQWLRIPFGPKVAGDVFQERIEQVLTNVPSISGILDDVHFQGNEEAVHDVVVIILPETVRAINLTFTGNKFVFKSKECALFGGKLTPVMCRVDPRKVQGFTDETARSAKFLGMSELP